MLSPSASLQSVENNAVTTNVSYVSYDTRSECQFTHSRHHTVQEKAGRAFRYSTSIWCLLSCSFNGP